MEVQIGGKDPGQLLGGGNAVCVCAFVCWNVPPILLDFGLYCGAWRSYSVWFQSVPGMRVGCTVQQMLVLAQLVCTLAVWCSRCTCAMACHPLRPYYLHASWQVVAAAGAVNHDELVKSVLRAFGSVPDEEPSSSVHKLIQQVWYMF